MAQALWIEALPPLVEGAPSHARDLPFAGLELELVEMLALRVTAGVLGSVAGVIAGVYEIVTADCRIAFHLHLDVGDGNERVTRDVHCPQELLFASFVKRSHSAFVVGKSN